MFPRKVDSIQTGTKNISENLSMQTVETIEPCRSSKPNNQYSKTYGQRLRERMTTVFCCVCIIVFGIAFLTKADPITTSIGENISTNDLSLSGSVLSGSWAGTAIDTAHGGTGQDWSTATQGSFPYFSDTGILSALSTGTAGQFLQSGGAGADPSWSNVTRSATFVIAASDSSTLSKQQADYVCDGVDDQVEIQAAIDALSVTGGTVKLLEGTFLLDAANDFYVNDSKYSISLEGNNIELLGSNGTILKLKDGINLGAGVNTFAAILILNGSHLSVHNITFNNNYSGVVANWNIAIWHGTSDINSPLKSCTSHFVDISNNHFMRQRKWAIWGDGGLSSYWNVHHNMVTPLSLENGFGFHNGPLGSQMTNNIIASETGSTINIGIFIDSVSDILISNNFIKKPKSWGIQAYDIVNSCLIINNIIEGSGAETTRGIRLHTKSEVSSACNNNIVEGNLLNDIPIGIKIDDSYVVNTIIKNNYFVSVATPIDDSGTDTIIQGNVGYATENSGTSTITTGQTSVTVTHGLAATPTRVQLTPTTLTGGKDYYISAKTATTFTITVDSSHTSDISFDWRAVVGEGN